MSDLYKILGVDKEATPKQIKRAYLDKCKEHHPDKGGDEEVFKEIGEAYNILSDVDLRKAYDNGDDLSTLKNKSNELIKRVMSVFQEALTSRGFVPDHVDLFKTMRELCNDKELRMNSNIETLNGMIANLKSIQKRMRRADVFKGFIDSLIAQHMGEIERVEEEKAYIGKILDFIADCAYEIDEDIETPRLMYF